MPKAYIAAPFTSKMANRKYGSYGEINNDEYKKFLESIESAVREAGFSTILPHRDISSWGKDPNLDLKECTKKYFEEISSSDLFVIYSEPGSRGSHIELGFAIALKKRIILLIKNDHDIGTVIPGLVSVANMDIIKFKNLQDLKFKLKNCLNGINETTKT
jgi:hypothetical protein